MPVIDESPLDAAQLTDLLDALTALRQGKRGVRLPVGWTGLAGKVADAFNEVVELNERMAGELGRLSRVVGKEGKLSPAAFAGQRRWFLGRLGRIGQRADRRPGASHQRNGPRHRRRRPRGPVANDGPGSGRPAAARGVSAGRPHDQPDGRSAQLVCLGSDPRGPRSGHRGEARRAGPGERGRRHVEGPDRKRQQHGQQPDQPGAQYRRRDDGRRQRESVEEDHGRCEGRDSGAEEHDQYDGRSAQLVRGRSDPRGPRSGHRRAAGRPGRRAWCRRHVEESDRQRQQHGRQPDRPGAQHRRRDQGRGRGRPVAQDHRRCEGRDPGAEEHDQYDGRSAPLVCLGSDPRGPRSGHRRQAGRPGRRAWRRWHVEGSDRQRELHGQQPDRPGAEHRRRDEGCGRGRSVAQDHRRCEGGDSGAQDHRQHNGGSAQLVRLGSDPRGPRSGHRGQAGRTGRRARRGRDVEGSD